MHPEKRKYVPDLADLQALCEHNYARILRLLQDIDEDQLSYCLRFSAALSYSVRLLDSGRYTTTLEITQLTNDDSPLRQADMVVRLYHDARMAEVTQCARMGSFLPRYAYPNRHMHHPDEKHMLNRFLGEWLSFCLRQKPKVATA